MTLLHAFMKPFWSPKTERIQLVVLCLLLSPPPPTRVAAPVSEQTNKEQRAPPAKQGGNGQLELLHSIPLHLARSSLQLQLKLCSLSLCALPHFQGTQTQEQQIIFLSIHTLPKHPLADTACPTSTSQSSLEAAVEPLS